jgi:hypothetical protein
MSPVDVNFTEIHKINCYLSEKLKFTSGANTSLENMSFWKGNFNAAGSTIN